MNLLLHYYAYYDHHHRDHLLLPQVGYVYFEWEAVMY